MLVANTLDDFNEAIGFVGRTVRDNIRQVGLEMVANKIATGQTVREVKKAIINKLIDEGVGGVVTKNGRTINLASYAETVARSTTREATNTATLNQLKDSGYDLVKISSHASKCGICAVYEGRVYSMSGNDSRFPKLSIAFSGVHMNIHPNCRHVLVPYIPAFNDVNKDIEYSNRPFNVDPRNKQQIEAYNNIEKQKQQLRNDRRQWERYRLALPDDTPKTLSTFRQMKKANSQRYQELLSDYKSLRQE